MEISKNLSLEELSDLAQRVERIMKSELEKQDLDYKAEARIFNVRNVGVQGDQRTYAYPAEIALYDNGRLIYDPPLFAKISTRITNEIKDVNRVAALIEVR